ncbi:Sec14p-like phosphatidylinositol transfer family protein [Actinidia rufa]|uniref:Sec14p-like phosphatidylinositol transfer family protein n=1 Tax=Actinidia rufa TaxID=165716 RepID=A0A7J0HG48_9ERIC|nr:Sec14p-like phosphatidylinositol transfer family protein [Actinidia rufa]
MWRRLSWGEMIETRPLNGGLIFDLFWVFWGNGVDGKKPFFGPLMVPHGALVTGDAKEKDRALRGEIRAGPRREGDELQVGPTLDADVSVNVRCHGLRESKWWETVNENREEEQEPILAVDGSKDGSNRRDEARLLYEKSLNSIDSSKSNDDTIVVTWESTTNGRAP